MSALPERQFSSRPLKWNKIANTYSFTGNPAVTTSDSDKYFRGASNTFGVALLRH